MNIPFKPGTIVRNKFSGEVVVVVANYGDRATAVREVSIMNAPEWDVVMEPRRPEGEEWKKA